jgi:hypothetical protein
MRSGSERGRGEVGLALRLLRLWNGVGRRAVGALIALAGARLLLAAHASLADILLGAAWSSVGVILLFHERRSR